MRYETLIFDLDGTISDPFVGISRSVNYSLDALGFETVDPSRIRPLIGPPLPEIYETLLGPQPDSIVHQLVEKYRERYGETGYRENRIYEQIPGIIADLAGAGYRMGICT